MDGLEKVQLRNGAMVPNAIVQAAYVNMLNLWEKNPIALYELGQIARNPDHVPFGGMGDVLIGAHLLDGDGQMHDDVRHVVLSSLTGDGLDMRLVLPVTG